MNNNRKTFLLIVDGSSLLATSYYASLPRAIRKEKDDEKKEELYPELLKNDGNGHYCNALELFFHTLFTIMTFQRPSHLVVCWDAGRNTFRRELWPLYKSNRQSTPTPLRQQFELAYDLCEQLGISQVRDSRYEADDFAGTIARKMSPQIPVRIYTRDKDYFQLINDQIKIWYGMADLKKVKEWRKIHHMPQCLPSRVVLIDRNVLKKEFGYHPESVPMIKCLFGDTSDNIPGVSGMGESRSIKLAAHYKCLADLYRDVDKASTKNERKNLNRLWRSWGIYVSPYTALTKKATAERKSAREMAEICYTLGKIRTDLDLEDCFEQGFNLKQFECNFDADQIVSTLKPYAIDLNIARNRMHTSPDFKNSNRKPRVYDEYKNTGSKQKRQADGKLNSSKSKSGLNRNEGPSRQTRPELRDLPGLKTESSLKKMTQDETVAKFERELDNMFSMMIANRDQIVEDYWMLDHIEEETPTRNCAPKRRSNKNASRKPNQKNRSGAYAKQRPNNRSYKSGNRPPKENTRKQNMKADVSNVQIHMSEGQTSATATEHHAGSSSQNRNRSNGRNRSRQSANNGNRQQSNRSRNSSTQKGASNNRKTSSGLNRSSNGNHRHTCSSGSGSHQTTSQA